MVNWLLIRSPAISARHYEGGKMRKVRKILGAIVKSVVVLALVLSSTGLTAQAAPADNLDSQINQVIEGRTAKAASQPDKKAIAPPVPVAAPATSAPIAAPRPAPGPVKTTRLYSGIPTSSTTTMSRLVSIGIISTISTRPSRSLLISHATASSAASKMSTIYVDPTAQSLESTPSSLTSEYHHISSRLSDQAV